MSSISLALVIHDLKNALGGLEGQLLCMTQVPSPELAKDAHERCMELRQRVVQFLTVYSAEHGLSAQCEDESPADLVNQLVNDTDAGRVVRKPKFMLTQARLENPPPFWYYDRRLVRMALEAAVHNAKRFAKKNITIGARAEPEHLVFFVEDDGPGLGAAEDPSKLSTGLGTHLCQAIALAHSHRGNTGQVKLKNRPEGGARFELWLP